MNRSTQFVMPGYVNGDPRRWVETTWHYEARDPFAVHMCLHAERIFHWAFARELLNNGVIEPAGDGDVHVRPAMTGGMSVAVTLRSPTGRVELHYDMEIIADWLAHTYELVPPDTEAEHIDWTAELSRVGVAKKA